MYRLWDTSFAMMSLLQGTKTVRLCGLQADFKAERRRSMKGFTTSTGYMGWVEDRYILFASEYDYREYMED